MSVLSRSRFARRWMPTSIVFAIALAACSNGATLVHLEVTADSSWGLDHYQLLVGDRSAIAASLPALDIEVPDSMSGHEQILDVWGLTAGQQIAFGTVTVTPSLHATAAASVSLDAIACGVWCNPGAIECSGAGTSTCQMATTGCVAWSTVTPCPSDAPYCSNGACAAQCSDECSVGQTECDSAVAVRTCEQISGDPCWSWSAATSCGNGQTCTNNVCGTAPTCANDGDSCDDGNACTVGDTCEASACSGTPKCTGAPANADPTCSANGTCGFTCHAGYMPSGAACIPNGKIVFLSSGLYNGNLGGLAGADTKCQGLATAAGLTGTFKAWLSDSYTSAGSRLSHATQAYILADGTHVADNWTALTTQPLLHAIDEDEHGNPDSSPPCVDAYGGPHCVWTATNGDGTLFTLGDDVPFARTPASTG